MIKESSKRLRVDPKVTAIVPAAALGGPAKSNGQDPALPKHQVGLMVVKLFRVQFSNSVQRGHGLMLARHG
jgi:hypothetical protein